MKYGPFLAATLGLAFLTGLGTAGEMTQHLQGDPESFAALRARLGAYGYETRQSIFLDESGLRLSLPALEPGAAQTGLYSHFALAGDCEVSLSYELLDLPSPQSGYGSGLGLAFDIEGGGGRGAIQRVLRVNGGNGYVLQTAPGAAPGAARGRLPAVDRFVPTTSGQGRIGLRRVKNELIFLCAEAPADPLREIGRLPFTDQTIRAVRVFVDPGGAPTAVDVRVTHIDIRSEEMTGGVPRIGSRQRSWLWLWLLLPAGGSALLFWTWRIRGRRNKFHD